MSTAVNISASIPLRVVGLDPGSRKMGFGVLEERLGRPPLLLEAGVLAPKADLPLDRRLLFLFQGLQELFTTFAPSEMAVENIFAGRNVQSAFVLGQARGVALLAAAQNGLIVFEYAPTRVKKSLVGSGSSDKQQVRHMVCRLLSVDLGKAPLDVSDALSLAICHLHSRGLQTRGLV